MTGPWRVTPAQVRAVVLGSLGALAAVLGRRPDLLVLATPFLVVATWGWLTRPTGRPELRTRMGHRALREGEGARFVAQVVVPEGGEDVVVGLGDSLFVEHEPVETAVLVPVEAATRAVDGASGTTLPIVSTVFAVRPTRWGRRSVGPATCVVLSPWGAYRSGPSDSDRTTLDVLPSPAFFDPQGAIPHPEGLVGLHRASRAGGGTEFLTLRPFQPGDRLRRIHWPTTLRTGTMHVSSTSADEDTQVVLLLDALSDLGPREGIDGRPTSLDLTVRAAAAMAEYFLGAGDRISLRVVGAAQIPRLPTGSGRRHLRRVLDVLVRIEPASERTDDGLRAIAGIDPGSLVVVLSPLVDETMVSLVARLGARGLTSVVADTMPEHLWAPGAGTGTAPGSVEVSRSAAAEAVAWRLRRLSRAEDIARLSERGIPVVPWRGPGSLDQVLRDLSRRARAPRVGRR